MTFSTLTNSGLACAERRGNDGAVTKGVVLVIVVLSANVRHASGSTATYRVACAIANTV